MGLSLSRGWCTSFFRAPCLFILLFDPRREHSSAPTAYCRRRRAQRWSRTALLQRRRRLVLDQREHGGKLPAIGWFVTRRSEGSLPLAAIDRANHACIRLNHLGPDHEAVYASASKAPRRRVHSPSGIAAIAVCGLPPPRIVIDYPAHQMQSGTRILFVLSRSRVLLTPPAAARHRPAPRRS
jgi:hypothetical protein